MEIKVNETVTLKAVDGSTGKCLVSEVKDGKVTIKYGNKTHTMTKAEFTESVVADPVHMPFKSVWKGQYVQVIERSSQNRVDSGVVSEVGSDFLCIGEEKYDAQTYDWLCLG